MPVRIRSARPHRAVVQRQNKVAVSLKCNHLANGLPSWELVMKPDDLAGGFQARNPPAPYQVGHGESPTMTAAPTPAEGQPRHAADLAADLAAVNARLRVMTRRFHALATGEMTRAEGIAVLLRDQIEQGVYKPGDKLPTQRAVAEEFDVSQATAYKALAWLANEGLVTSRRGWFVADADDDTQRSGRA